MTKQTPSLPAVGIGLSKCPERFERLWQDHSTELLEVAKIKLGSLEDAEDAVGNSALTLLKIGFPEEPTQFRRIALAIIDSAINEIQSDRDSHKHESLEDEAIHPD